LTGLQDGEWIGRMENRCGRGIGLSGADGPARYACPISRKSHELRSDSVHPRAGRCWSTSPEILAWLAALCARMIICFSLYPGLPRRLSGNRWAARFNPFRILEGGNRLVKGQSPSPAQPIPILANPAILSKTHPPFPAWADARQSGRTESFSSRKLVDDFLPNLDSSLYPVFDRMGSGCD